MRFYDKTVKRFLRLWYWHTVKACHSNWTSCRRLFGIYFMHLRIKTLTAWWITWRIP